MTAKAFLMTFLIAWPATVYGSGSPYGFDSIREQVDHECNLIFKRLDLQEVILPVGQDTDDLANKKNNDKRQSVKIGLDELKKIAEDLNNLSLDFKQALHITQAKDQEIGLFSVPTVDDGEGFVFKPEKYSPDDLVLYYTGASMGNADAIFAIGFHEEVKKNLQKALKFYCSAAYKNSMHARERLATAYLKGELGLEKNDFISRKYSSNQGNFSTLSSYSSTLTPLTISTSSTLTASSIHLTPGEMTFWLSPQKETNRKFKCCHLF